ncbi:hypothetical protein AB0M68_33670 [Streptomyces sp. NPDC051453]
MALKNTGSVRLLQWVPERPSQSMSMSAFQYTASPLPQTGMFAGARSSVR